MAWRHGMAGPCMTWHGMSRHGMARHGRAWHGRHGMATGNTNGPFTEISRREGGMRIKRCRRVQATKSYEETGDPIRSNPRGSAWLRSKPNDEEPHASRLCDVASRSRGDRWLRTTARQRIQRFLPHTKFFPEPPVGSALALGTQAASTNPGEATVPKNVQPPLKSLKY